jgi:hypothetical protein
MSKFDFRIAAEAVEYLKKNLLVTDMGESLVLTVAPHSSRQKFLSSPGNGPDFSDEKVGALAKDFIKSLSSPVGFDWVVGGMRKSRLPEQELLPIDGIECFFPDDVRSVINGRVLRLRDGELVFDPELKAPPSLPLR